MKNLVRKYIINIIMFGMMVFAITGCSQPTEQTVVESTVEMVEESVEETSTIAEENDLGIGQEAEVVEEYTLDFVDAGNEDMTELEQGDMVTVPEYERQKLIDLIPIVFEHFKPDLEDVASDEVFEILETTENADGSKTYNVAIKSDKVTNNLTTQYSVDKETGLAKALFVYQVPNEIDVPAENFGLIFEVTKTTDDTVTVDKILDLYGNDVSDITLYAGDCIGWSMTKWAEQADFDFGDELSISQDLSLYPVMDLSNKASVDEDFTEGVWVLSYNGTAIKMTETFDGTTISDSYQVVDGQLVDTTGKTVVDKESGEVSDAPEKAPAKEQGSTSGGTGNTPSTPNTTSPTPSSEGQLSDEEYNRLLQQYGITNGGSGLDTSGMDHGSGGAGWVLQ